MRNPESRASALPELLLSGPLRDGARRHDHLSDAPFSSLASQPARAAPSSLPEPSAIPCSRLPVVGGHFSSIRFKLHSSANMLAGRNQLMICGPLLQARRLDVLNCTLRLRHKCPINEPEIRPVTTQRPKGHSAQILIMSHDETFMSHHGTSSAFENSPEIGWKIGKALGNSENRRKLPVWRPGEAASRGLSCDRARKIPSRAPGPRTPFSVPLSAAPGR